MSDNDSVSQLPDPPASAETLQPTPEGQGTAEMSSSPQARERGLSVSEGSKNSESKPAVSHSRWTRLSWALGLVAFLGALVWMAVAVKSVAVPLLTAFIIAYLLDPVVDRFEARGWSRTLGIVSIFLSSMLVLTVFTFAIVPPLVAQFAEVPDKLSEFVDKGIPWVETTFRFDVPAELKDLPAALRARLGENVPDLNLESLMSSAQTWVAAAFGGTVGFLGSLAGILMIPFFTFYLLRDFDDIVSRIDGLLPVSLREPVRNRFREIDQAMSSFIRGQLIVATILAVLYSVGLAVVGLPLALVVGVFAGFGNIVPYLGTTLGIVLATIMAVLDWSGFGNLMLVYGVFVIVQGLEGWVITPKIVGESVDLSSFAVIVAVLVFGEMFGFVGVLFAVPLAAILKILGRVAVEAYLESDFYRTN